MPKLGQHPLVSLNQSEACRQKALDGPARAPSISPQGVRVKRRVPKMVAWQFLRLTLALNFAVASVASLAFLLFLASGWNVWILMAAGAVCLAGFIWLYSELGA